MEIMIMKTLRSLKLENRLFPYKKGFQSNRKKNRKIFLKQVVKSQIKSIKLVMFKIVI